MAKKLIIGNWKMNPRDRHEAAKIFRAIQKDALQKKNTTTVICPPTPFLGALSELNKKNSKCFLGAQDVFWETEGAFTGEVSPFMLSSVGARYVIVGHSERRMLGDTDDIVAKKLRLSLQMGFFTVLCVGERERDESGKYFHFIQNEIQSALTLPSKLKRRLLSHLVIAYEPIWAIGEGAARAIVPEDLFEMTIFIRKTITDIFDANTARDIPILYGGSVDEKNAGGFLGSRGGADGLLVGRASLDAKKFAGILNASEQIN